MAIPNWLHLSQVSGSGDTVITITADTSAELSERIYNLVVSGHTKSVTVPVIQSKPNSREYLTFDIKSSGNIRWRNIGGKMNDSPIEYQLNNGPWTEIHSYDGTTIAVASGDVLKFRGDNDTYAGSQSGENTSFSGSTATFEVRGNIMSLFDSVNYADVTSITKSWALQNMFAGCTGLTHAFDLVLPATYVSGWATYEGMFAGCKSLVDAPELPLMTMRNFTYSRMFAGCTSLVTPPELPATTLEVSCYRYMFADCTALTSTPSVLPASNVSQEAYSYMFRNCTNITSANIAATACGYQSLYCMFSGCTKLNNVTCMLTYLGTSATTKWMYSVSATGTFTKNSSMTSWSTGINGIPSGWTVLDAT